MLDSIDNFEKSIEEFQNNVAASGRLCDLLDSYLQQMRLQNDSFNEQSGQLLKSLSEIPDAVEKENSENNVLIKKDVGNALNDSLKGFELAQNKSISALEESCRDFREDIERTSDSLGNALKSYSDELQKTQTKIAELETIPDTVKKGNLENNALIKDDVGNALNDSLKGFELAQNKSISALEESCRTFSAEVKRMTDGLENDLKSYSAELQRTQTTIEGLETQVEQSYGEFIKKLESMNISNLYNQSTEIKKTLNIRTIVLMLISIVSVLLGIVGLFI